MTTIISDQPVLVDYDTGTSHAVSGGHVLKNVKVGLQEVITEIALRDGFHSWRVCGLGQHFE